MRRSHLTAALGTASLVLSVAACASGGNRGHEPRPPFDRPSVTLRDARINGVGITGGSMLVSLRVYNPNDYRLVAPRVFYRVFVEGDQLASGRYDVDVEIPAHDSATLQVPVPFSYESAGQAGRAMLKAGAVNYRVLGSLVVGTPYGRLTSPYDRTGQFSTLSRVSR